MLLLVECQAFKRRYQQEVLLLAARLLVHKTTYGLAMLA